MYICELTHVRNYSTNELHRDVRNCSDHRRSLECHRWSRSRRQMINNLHIWIFLAWFPVTNDNTSHPQCSTVLWHLGCTTHSSLSASLCPCSSCHFILRTYWTAVQEVKTATWCKCKTAKTMPFQVTHSYFMAQTCPHIMSLYTRTCHALKLYGTRLFKAMLGRCRAANPVKPKFREILWSKNREK